LNDRGLGEIASEYGKCCGIFSQDVSGHCDLFDVSKLSWSLVIDQIIIWLMCVWVGLLLVWDNNVIILWVRRCSLLLFREHSNRINITMSLT